MAASGFVDSLLGGLETATKKVLTEAFRYVLRSLTMGPVDHQVKAGNFDAFYVVSTTATSTGEFSIVHGMGRTPYLAKIATDLSLVGSGMPTLRVSRAADSVRVYLKADAGSTNMVFGLYLE
jgi:hypothetical protein